MKAEQPTGSSHNCPKCGFPVSVGDDGDYVEPGERLDIRHARDCGDEPPEEERDMIYEAIYQSRSR